MSSQSQWHQNSRLNNDVTISMMDFLENHSKEIQADLLADPTIADELLEAGGIRSKRKYRRSLVRKLWPYVINHRRDLLERLLQQTVLGGAIYENATYILECAARSARGGDEQPLLIADQHTVKAIETCAPNDVRPLAMKITSSVIRGAINSALRPGACEELSQFLAVVGKCELPFKQTVRESGFSLLASCLNGEASRGDGTMWGETKIVDALLEHGANLDEKIPTPDVVGESAPTPLAAFVIREKVNGMWMGDIVGHLFDRGIDWRRVLADPSLSQEYRVMMEQLPYIKRALLTEQAGNERTRHDTPELLPRL